MEMWNGKSELAQEFHGRRRGGMMITLPDTATAKEIMSNVFVAHNKILLQRRMMAQGASMDDAERRVEAFTAKDAVDQVVELGKVGQEGYMALAFATTGAELAQTYGGAEIPGSSYHCFKVVAIVRPVRPAADLENLPTFVLAGPLAAEGASAVQW